MNIHTPQTVEADAELKYLFSTKHNIITAQASKPIISITQDSLISAFLMTKTEFILKPEHFFDLTLRGELWDGTPLWNDKKIKTVKKVYSKYGRKEKKIIKKEDIIWLDYKKYSKYEIDLVKRLNPNCTILPEHLRIDDEDFVSYTNTKFLYTGRTLISLLLPDDLFYENENKASAEEPIVKIFNGVLYEGIIDKKIIGTEHNSLIQILNKEYGADVCSNFINNIQFITNGWMKLHGFSIGLEDCMTSKNTVSDIKNTITRCYMEADCIDKTTINEGIKEVRITNCLNNAKNVGLKMAKDSMRKENNFLTTINSGAKGDFFNISQITGLLGQQTINGQRIPSRLSHNRRTLPHYKKNEKSYTSKGFIENSFVKGLSPEDFFFHAMAGREGVIDKAMKTANVGYVQRRMIKNLEDVIVGYDGTVKDSNNVYQLAYGDNGYDPLRTVRINGKSKPEIVNINRLVNKLNLCHENGVKETKEFIRKEPSFHVKEIKKVRKDTEGKEKEMKEKEEKEEKERDDKERKEREEKEDEDFEDEEDDFEDEESEDDEESENEENEEKEEKEENEEKEEKKGEEENDESEIEIEDSEEEETDFDYDDS
jgi:DNA-directed RNA polymerase beta' subunit